MTFGGSSGSVQRGFGRRRNPGRSAQLAWMNACDKSTQCISKLAAAAIDIKILPTTLRGTGAKASVLDAMLLETSPSPQALHFLDRRLQPERARALERAVLAIIHAAARADVPASPGKEMLQSR
mmetsp:Transcript_61441/g.126870  ORF Transcript_61441/g.126870 Transcript_61441/m.126870 type:complete len:124 (+) Transcript_61441:477-848(+)